MKTNKLFVKYNGILVGTLALAKDKRIAFQYSKEWIRNGFSINPFSLPLNDSVFLPKNMSFNGLFGIFSDSLPDNWGNLLLDRVLISKEIKKEDINMLDRLAIIGKNGMGALEYEPEISYENDYYEKTLDEISIECSKILKSEYSNDLDLLFKLGGSSGGARPKVLMKIDNTNWIIKFSNHIDRNDSGLMEYEYALCAKACGIDMPLVKLFDSKMCSGYFGIERFDINHNSKLHMATVAGLLEADYRSPCLDYNDLLKLTKIITNDIDTYQMFRRMCFNIYSHNMDDHAKNFSFIYKEDIKAWRLSPAYDLTYSNTYYGEHTTSVNGKGKNITDEDILEVAKKNHLNVDKCKKIMMDIKIKIEKNLSKYLK